MTHWFARLRSSSSRREGADLRRPLLRLELLEDRLVLAPMTFTVTDTSDASANSLRAAITASNANNPGVGMFNTVNFAITGAGVRTISLLSSLPAITHPVMINGYSENNGTRQATANTLANADNAVILIQVDGTSAGTNVNGLTLGAGSAGSTIKGLDVTNFQGDGNLNNGVGILVQSNGNTIVGNFVGVNPAGTTETSNQGDGIRIVDASNNIIGTTNPADRNIVSGNFLDGIHVEGTLTAPATGNLIQGNFVGVAANGVSSVGTRTAPIPSAAAEGTAAGNFLFGIEISGGNSNTIGGPTAGARNVVGFNAAGIEIDNGGQQNTIQGNFSGVGADGVTAAANLLHGIDLRSSNGFSAPLGPAQPNEPGVSNNTIGGTAAGDGNLVEFNGTAGVAVFGNPVSASGQPNIGNAIEGNSIFKNGRNYLTASSAPTPLLGIDLTNGFLFPKDDGATPNDSKGHGAPNDPNNFQNFPVLTSAAKVSGGFQIAGSLNQSVSPNTTFRIEFFASDPDPLGLPAEGQQFLGFTNVTTDGRGNVSFSVVLNVAVANGRIVTATATDPNGNTSEFSVGLAAPTPPPTVVVETNGALIEFVPGVSQPEVLSQQGSVTAASAVLDGSGNTVVFVITTGLEGAQYNNTLWKFNPATGWSQQSSGFFQQISAATDASGNAIVFGLTTAGALYEQSNTNVLNAGFTLLSQAGSVLNISAVTTSSGDDTVYVITTGLQGAQYANTLWRHSTATGWIQLSSGSFQQVSAGLNVAGQAEVFTVLTNQQLWEENPANGMPVGLNTDFTQVSGSNGLPAAFLSVAAAGPDKAFAIAADSSESANPSTAQLIYEHTPTANTLISQILSAAHLSANASSGGADEVFATLIDGSFFEYSTSTGFDELLGPGMAASSSTVQ